MVFEMLLMAELELILITGLYISQAIIYYKLGRLETNMNGDKIRDGFRGK